MLSIVDYIPMNYQSAQSTVNALGASEYLVVVWLPFDIS